METRTVAVKIKFTFRNRTTIVQRSLYGTKTVQKTVLIYYYVSVYAHLHSPSGGDSGGLEQ